MFHVKVDIKSWVEDAININLTFFLMFEGCLNFANKALIACKH